jgi:hypothetical protein
VTLKFGDIDMYSIPNLDFGDRGNLSWPVDYDGDLSPEKRKYEKQH